MAEREADTVVILSSELISKITEEYFNKTMFKQKVEIVDLKPTETGYMFSVSFISKEKKSKQAVIEPSWQQSLMSKVEGVKVMQRGKNGQFKKAEVS